MLRRILQNLISNAIRYTNQGRVVVGARRRGQHVQLEIRDTGIGIAVEHQQKIFEEFQRLHDPAKPLTPGHGLGLAISQRLARALHTLITVESRPQHGSCFTLRLERATARSVPTEETAAPSRDQPFAGLRVLCLDNEPAMLSGLASLLASWGCQVLTAKDRQEFQQQMSAKPEIVLADYQLDHGDNGVAVWQQLAEPRPPLIVLTASREAEVKAHVISASGEYLAKPVKPLALRGLLQRLRSLSTSEVDAMLTNDYVR